MIVQGELLDLNTPTGPMRTYVYTPVQPGGKDARVPGLLLYSEIFQQTPPINRLAVQFAGQGFAVFVPEIYHEHEPPGTVLGYDDAGKNKGNAYKGATKLSRFDDDARIAISALTQHPRCNGRLGTVGFCIGGHLAFRAAFNPEILAAACFYPTDLASGDLGAGKNADSLQRASEIGGEVVMIFGRQDPHIPFEGRVKVHEALERSGMHYGWHEFNAVHAFMRDEGDRYDPAVARQAFGLARDLFKRAL